MSEFYPATTRTAQQLTVSNTVIKMTALDENVTHVMIDFQGDVIRVTFDGTDPSPTRGFRFLPTNCPIWNRHFAESAKFIREGSSDGAVHIQPLQM